MKRNRMKITAPEFWFSESLRIIRELDVDDIDILIVCSRSMCRDRVLFIAENMSRVRIDQIEVVIFEPHVVL